MLKFASLGSGSSGNGTVVSFDETHLLVDCGFAMKEAQKRLERLDLCLSQITAVLVTHEHGDHIKGVAAIARRYGTPTYMTPGTYHSRDLGRIPELNLIHNYQSFTIGPFRVQPVAVPHDAREPAQFVFYCQGRSVGILTDLGSITSHVIAAYYRCDALLVEANHDRTVLAEGPYPRSVKARIASPWGHLNNEQAADFLAQIDTDALQHLVVGHISRQNNSIEHAANALAEVTESLPSLLYACQDEGFGWLHVS